MESKAEDQRPYNEKGIWLQTFDLLEQTSRFAIKINITFPVL